MKRFHPHMAGLTPMEAVYEDLGDMQCLLLVNNFEAV